jgi:hypothetical protein
MSYIGKANKDALKKFVSLEKKTKDIKEKIKNYSNEMEMIKNSIPFPLFTKETLHYESKFIAYISPKKCIEITKRKGSKYLSNYTIESFDLDLEFSYEDNEINIKNLSQRITKKEFVQVYNEAVNATKNIFSFSTRIKREIICEKNEKN